MNIDLLQPDQNYNDQVTPSKEKLSPQEKERRMQEYIKELVLQGKIPPQTKK